MTVEPHSLPAERALLGGILVSPKLLDDVQDVVTPADFYRTAHQILFRHMLKLADAGRPIDYIPLKDSLLQSGELDEVDGPAYVIGLAEGVPTDANAAEYARMVRDCAVKRAVMKAARQTIAEAPWADSAADMLEQAQQRLWAIALKQQTGELVFAEQMVKEAWEKLEDLATRRGQLRGVPTGLVDLDTITGGLQATDLVILAARPAMGKTALAVNSIAASTAKAGVLAAIFSLEMSRDQLLFRIAASEAGVNVKRLTEGRLTESDYARLSVALGQIAEWPLAIDDTAQTTVADIRAKCRRMQARRGLGLIVIDYMQLMEDPSRRKGDSRVLELATISRGLKQIAKELKVPVLALSQLSREVERRSPPRPQLADLRDSGALEQDADVVLLLWREEEYQATPQNQGLAEIIIAKQRQGPTGAITVKFWKDQTKFTNLAHEPEYAR